MHDEEGPRRLRQGADTPEALLRALAALRKGVDDSARLERVGQRMEAVLDAPHAPIAAEASRAARRGLWGNKLSALKFILGGLALFAPLFFFQHMDEATVPAGDSAGSRELTEAPQKTQADTATESQPVATETNEVERAVAPPVVTEAAGASAEATAPRRGAKAAHAAAMRARKLREPAAQAPTNEAVASAVVAPEPVTATPQNNETAPAVIPPKPTTSERKAETAQEAPRESEADLLLKARQALKRDPSLALRWVSEHQARFANGRLVPEREVLAIEALRNLGKKKEADERLHKFEARYPNSIHLKRLHEAR